MAAAFEHRLLHGSHESSVEVLQLFMHVHFMESRAVCSHSVGL